MGVLVVFGGEIHHARCARKTDTTSLVAFSSPQTGPLGRVTEGHPTIWSRLPRNPPLDPPELDRRVLVIPTSSGDDGTLARAALSTEPDGVVIGTLGAGHLAPALLELWAEAAKRIPVVAYCRPERGVVLTGTYGYAGSEQDLRGTSIIPAGFLSPQAARMKLLACVASASASTRSAGRSARTTAEPAAAEPRGRIPDHCPSHPDMRGETDSDRADAVIARLADRQHGVVSRRQLTARRRRRGVRSTVDSLADCSSRSTVASLPSGTGNCGTRAGGWRRCWRLAPGPC